MHLKRGFIRLLSLIGLSDLTRYYYNYARLLLNPELLRRNRALSHNPPDGIPFPPLRLIYLVTGRFNVEHFYKTGSGIENTLTTVLDKVGEDIMNSGPVLDFGCGCGRSMRHLKKLEGLGLHGTDYNPELVEWCRNNLTFAEFHVNGFSTMTSYRDEQFGLIYALSVFTHLNDELQHFWIRELSRIIRRGGFLLVTTHGDFFLDHLSTDEKTAFAAGELVVLRSKLEGKNECAAYTPKKYMINLIDGLFEPALHLPGTNWQDIWLLKKL